MLDLPGSSLKYTLYTIGSVLIVYMYAYGYEITFMGGGVNL